MVVIVRGQISTLRRPLEEALREDTPATLASEGEKL
jgi:hypothetical protein